MQLKNTLCNNGVVLQIPPPCWCIMSIVFFSAQVQEETERVGGCDPPVTLIQSLFLQEVLGLGPNTKHQAEKLSIFTRQRSAALHSSLLVDQQSVCGCIYNPVSPVWCALIWFVSFNLLIFSAHALSVWIAIKNIRLWHVTLKSAHAQKYPSKSTFCVATNIFQALSFKCSVTQQKRSYYNDYSVSFTLRLI